MAVKKISIEDTVDDILNAGIDFRPQTMSAKTATGHVVKPANFDGQFLVNSSGGLTIEVKAVGSKFDHALDRDIEGRIIVDQDVAANIRISATDKKSVTLTSTATVNAKIIIF